MGVQKFAIDDKLLTAREASAILGISEKDVIDLAHLNLLPHFKVAGEFVRFKRKDIVKVKDTVKKKYNLKELKSSRKERLKEFFYFNDFYIVSLIVIVCLLWVIVKDFFH